MVMFGSHTTLLVVLIRRLVDVATGYVTSTEVAEVVQAVVGTGTSLVDIAQSAGDAWHSGTAHFLLPHLCGSVLRPFLLESNTDYEAQVC
jgi:hypothetical protein